MSKSKKERRDLVSKKSGLSVVRQCELLDIHHGAEAEHVTAVKVDYGTEM
ncbi:MAG: hypothetical protein NXH90_02685 [Flavobacteriaceae bacterium]|nr:hypothetical protein [Flavobacteriaceae bacterium]